MKTLRRFDVLLAFVLGVLAGSPPIAAETATVAVLRTDTASFEIDATGSLRGIVSQGNHRNYLAPGQPAPLLSVRVNGTTHAPDQAEWSSDRRQLTLHYGAAGVRVVLSGDAKPSHLALTVAEVEPVDRVELVVWGPYPTTIGDIIGETVGVVRDREFAVGLQALNPKTLSGLPQENDVETGWEGDDRGGYDDLPRELGLAQNYRGDAARGAPFGSTLRAYCRNRNRERVVANWNQERYVAPAFADGGVIGSRIALFAGPAEKALDTIGQIELTEGLPHPLIDGVWGKVSPGATASYLIVDFSEATLERAIEMARRAGLKYIYHSSPFATWGHFKLKPDAFPHGWDGLRACAEKARTQGIRVGVHTLSNFITPNDAYVTPTPDRRLARIGASELAAEIDAAQKEIPVADGAWFAKKNDLNAARIGDELIRFGTVSTNAPWRLLGCERGAWGTRAAGHSPGEPVVRLADHAYQVLLTNPELSQEVARNIAALFNQSGALQLSFDGLEGNWATGLGHYGSALFTKAWYDALLPELRGRIINDASNPGHFNWHINTRMNWGEPWYAGFRESQTLYRFKNQFYFERNFFPRMLGWFALRPETSLEDIEWMLARAAGYHAGFGLATSLASTAQLAADPASADTLQKFGAMPAILQAIQHWETARLARAFPPAVRAALRDNTREFHLAPVGPAAWDLFEVASTRFAHDAARSADTESTFEQRHARQPLQWTLRNETNAPVQQLTLQLDQARVLDLKDQPLPAGAILKYTGGREAVICDATWKELARVPVDAEAAITAPGQHRVKMGCALAAGTRLKLELRSLDAPTRITTTPSAPPP